MNEIKSKIDVNIRNKNKGGQKLYYNMLLNRRKAKWENIYTWDCFKKINGIVMKPCPYCNSKEVGTFYDEDRYYHSECVNCGLIAYGTTTSLYKAIELYNNDKFIYNE